MTTEIVVVDYKTSNIKSVGNMLRRIGTKVSITSEPSQIRSADKLILPGIGAFDAAVRNLKASGLIEALNEAVTTRGVAVLGICLGMQLLAESSQEGELCGLGWIPGIVRRFECSWLGGQGLPIPHMGWNYVHPVNGLHPMFRGVPTPMRFYFVHSYHFVPRSFADAIGVTNYGYDFVSAVARDNVWGVQFHPEKSHKYGMQLLHNFVEFA